MRNILCAIALSVVAVSASAADEMKKLDWMVGEWKGEAWYQRGQAPREQILQHEKVTPRAGGKALLVEGTGRKKLENGTPGEIVHDAIGLIAWSDELKQYRFSAYTASSPGIETSLDPTGSSWIWGFAVPQGRIRYTIRQTERGEWNETGEFSRDGEKWMKFFEMTLTKVK